MDITEPRILIIEDSATLALTYETYLGPLDGKVKQATCGKDGLDLIDSFEPHLIILDLKLPDMDGLDILRSVATRESQTRVIVITAHGSVQTAVEAMRQGAADFLLKPFAAERLVTTARNALELQRLTRIIEGYKERKGGNFGGFIGNSSAMKAVYSMISDAATSRASVFITGESGTGKEVAAETLHRLSPRFEKPFVALNCAAIPATLIESEIFGHKRGAFTGANEDRTGAAKRADGGTLFLDEICEMPLELQAKLLRFIQTGQYVPIGGNKTETVNVRFICATNRVPWDEVRAGRFREDLYYRLHVIPIHLPTLPERGDDVVQLAHFFLRKFAAEENKAFEGIDDDAKELLLGYHWPGNVRELANVIQSAVVLKEGPVLTAAMLWPSLGPADRRPAGSGGKSDPGAPSRFDSDRETAVLSGPEPLSTEALAAIRDLPTLADMEGRLISEALNRAGGQVSRAAAILGVHPSTLYRKLERRGIA